MAPEKPNNTNRATARALLRAEYIFFSRPDVKLTTDRLLRVPPEAVNRRLLKERLNLNPGLKGKTKAARESHLNLF